MNNRISWAAYNAFYSTLTFTVIALIISLAMIIYGQPESKQIGMIGLVLPILPFLVRMQNFCDMYRVKSVKSPRRDFELQVGHIDEFKKLYHIWPVGNRLLITHLDAKPEGIGEIHAALLSNDMVVVAMHQRHLDMRNIVLREGWPFYPLVANCKAQQLIMTWSRPDAPLLAEIKTEHVLQ